MVKLKRIITFPKGLRKKNKSNNEEQIKKHNTTNLDCKIKLKTIKTFTNRLMKKIEIKRIRINFFLKNHICHIGIDG
jgi:hypothetical protein